MEKYFKNSYKNETAPIPLTIKSVGFQKCTPGHQWGPGIRDHYLIHYVVSGSGEYSIGSSSFPVRAGQLFLVWPNTIIKYHADEQTPWEYYWLGFTGPDASALIGQSEISPASPVASIDFGQEFRRYITAIYESRGQSLKSRTQMLGYAYLLLGKLVKSGPPSDGTDLAEKAAEFIDNNYSEQISTEDIAAYIGTSRSWLYRCFIRKLGISPSAYLLELRMYQAKYLLENTALQISEIACSVGYADALYFSRAFSRHTGMSPTAFRRQE